MDGLNHLREQCADTIVDKTLEEMYSLLIVQIQPEFLLNLINAHHKRGKRYVIIGCSALCEEKKSTHKTNLITLRVAFSSVEISGILDLSINVKRFNIRLLLFLKMLYASQQ